MILDREAASLPLAWESDIDPDLEPPLQTPPSGPPRIDTRFIDPLSSGNEWDGMVIKHSGAHVFHSSAWARVLARTYGHTPFYIVASQEEKAVALLPLMEVRSRLNGVRGVSLPFSDFCAPLFLGKEGYETAVEAAVAMGRVRGWKHLELRGSAGSTSPARHSASFYAHTLDLRRSESELFEGCSSSARRGVRKAEKGAVAIEIESSRRSLREFYGLHCQTRRTHGLPPQPWTFFEHIHDEILRAGNGCVVVARQCGKAIAAAVFFRFGKHSLYKFGASNAAAVRVRGNNLVIWEGIKFLARSRAEFLHFGRTDLGQDGLRRFKLSWGSVEEQLQYLRFDFRQERWTVVEPEPRRFHHHFFRHLPLSLNRAAGAVIYPHLD